MLFPDEVVPRGEVEVPTARAEASDGEVAMASQLVESLSGDFEAERYRDTYREHVLELIECKARGEEVVTEPAAERREPAPDLMAALEASIARARGGEGAGADTAANGGRAERAPAGA